MGDHKRAGRSLAEVGRQLAVHFTARLMTEDRDPEALMVEAEYAVLNEGCRLMRDGASRQEAEAAVVAIRTAMIAEGRRLSASVNTTEPSHGRA